MKEFSFNMHRSRKNMMNFEAEFPFNLQRINMHRKTMFFEEGHRVIMSVDPRVDDLNPKYGEIEEILDGVEKRFNRLKNFEITRSDPPSDHRYYYATKSKVLLRSNRGVRMAEEHKLLEEKLPKSIFVKAYQSHADVLRAAIVGPPNTPYGHALFFFDIQIPKGYPSCPPKFHYISYDLSLSPPVLGEAGKVNLTLLEQESWYARIMNRLFGSNYQDQDPERWDPKETTILDVLLAIQKSLSIHSPEHWLRSNYRSNNEGEYDDKLVWLSTCEGMMRTLEKPPKGFEDLVRGHFRKSAHTILMLFREVKDAGETVISMFDKLFKAFEDNGTYCNHHLGQVGQIKKTEEEKEEKDENKAKEAKE